MKQLGFSKNGIPVYDRKRSHIHGDIEPLIGEVLPQYELTEKIEKITHDFGRVIGKTYCVRITQEDEIYYKRRKGRKGVSKFVRNRKPEPSKLLTIILKKMEEREGYVVLTAFVGAPAEPEIWDENAFLRDKRGYKVAKMKSAEFWANHALIEEEEEEK